MPDLSVITEVIREEDRWTVVLLHQGLVYAVLARNRGRFPFVETGDLGQEGILTLYAATGPTGWRPGKLNFSNYVGVCLMRRWAKVNRLAARRGVVQGEVRTYLLPSLHAIVDWEDETVRHDIEGGRPIGLRGGLGVRSQLTGRGCPTFPDGWLDSCLASVSDDYRAIVESMVMEGTKATSERFKVCYETARQKLGRGAAEILANYPEVADGLTYLEE